MCDICGVIFAHAARYPQMRPCDAVKLVYQNEFGCRHIAKSAGAREELMAELSRSRGRGVACEEIGNGMSRLFLSPDMNGEAVWRVVSASARRSRGNIIGLREKLGALLRCAEQGAFSFGAAELSGYIDECEAAGFPPVGHSAEYKHAYNPSYRVIDSRFVRLLPLIFTIEDKLSELGRAAVAIDGRAASGKSTAAALISELYDCAVVHMDDFFLPPELRTAARYAEPGGNIHYERFKAEVSAAILAGGAISYGRFSCREGRVTEKVQLPKSALIVVEGAYSLHPCFGDIYDIRAFSTVESEEQRRRIAERDGAEAQRRFEELWIPLEERYFEAFGIGEGADTIKLY